MEPSLMREAEDVLDLIDRYLEDRDYEDQLFFLEGLEWVIGSSEQRSLLSSRLQNWQANIEELRNEDHSGADGLSPAERNPGLR